MQTTLIVLLPPNCVKKNFILILLPHKIKSYQPAAFRGRYSIHRTQYPTHGDSIHSQFLTWLNYLAPMLRDHGSVDTTYMNARAKRPPTLRRPETTEHRRVRLNRQVPAAVCPCLRGKGQVDHSPFLSIVVCPCWLWNQQTNRTERQGG
jgi:hypothetical protein